VSAGPGRALGPAASCTQRGGSKSIEKRQRNTRAKSLPKRDNGMIKLRDGPRVDVNGFSRNG